MPSLHEVYIGITMKNLRVVLEDGEFEFLSRLKGDRSWRDFLLSLARFYVKSQRESEHVDKDALLAPYKAQSRALMELGKLMIEEENGYRYKADFYLASLIPLLVSGEDVADEDLVDAFVLVTNLVFKHLKKKHDDSKMFAIFEYLRVALVRELRGDTEVFKHFIKETCKELHRLGELS